MTHAAAVAALTPQRWTDSGQRMVAKTLTELAYEQLLVPQPDGDGRWRLTLPGGISYTFSARRRLWEGLRVEPGSVHRCDDRGEHDADDPTQLLLDLHEHIGADPTTTGHLVRELAVTRLADVHIAAGPQHTAAELVDCDYADAEGAMDGHPWLIPNKGRLGFGHADYLRYAPERSAPLRLPWLAAHPRLGTWQAVRGLDHRTLRAAELDPATRDTFSSNLERAVRDRAANADISDYRWFPVHPWQLDNVVLPLFAGELARGDLVLLGEAPDRYLPQQSIRTLTNREAPLRHHVKLPLSVLNTLVWRGLPTERTIAAPRVTEYLHGVRDGDPFLRDECRPVLLGEVASVAVEHSGYAALPGAPYQYLELLGCIWRESITGYLEPGERALTMAALLHVDPSGTPVVAALIDRSGLSVTDWIARLLNVVLPPLLRMLYKHGVVFSPHGENAILLHRNGIPSRLAIKDFVDDVNVSDQPLPELADMPADVGAVLLREPADWLCQFLWAGLFVGHFRYLGDLLETRLGLAERTFWGMVRTEITTHQSHFPDLADRYALFDLLQPRISRICLNRNRLLLDGYADRPERPHAATYGTVRNALHEVGR